MLKSECCAAEAIERSYPSLLLSRTMYICTNCGKTTAVYVEAKAK